MLRTVVSSRVSVIGDIWMPATTCAMDYTLSGYDVENIRAYGDGEITREAVEEWVSLNTGDFSRIIDFCADIADGDVDRVFGWTSDENEMIYCDCMFGSEMDAMFCEETAS